MMHGPQRDLFDLEFAVPSECADRLADGRADIGIVPVAALIRNPLEVFRGTGIACRGTVRSILLISKTPLDRIQVLATDSGSRSSVMLARVILQKRYNVTPGLVSLAPDLDAMLELADAALIIGDAALFLDPVALRARGLTVLDLGEEWVSLTGLPMVFAVWAGNAAVYSQEREKAFLDSCRFGVERLEEIVEAERVNRGLTADMVRRYLTENVSFELGEPEYKGMERFLQYAREIGPHEFLETAAPARRSL
jgi:predicted solute-binding protein